MLPGVLTAAPASWLVQQVAAEEKGTVVPTSNP
jgi:hypothetical protein